MSELSEKQVEFVRSHIRKRGVKNTQVENDLTDHICCLIEAELDKGNSFHDALLKSIRSFGPHGIKKVEIETGIEVYKYNLLIRILHSSINILSLGICIFFIIFPFIISIQQSSVFFAFLCFPLIITGVWAVVFGFNYRKFEYKIMLK